MSAVIQRWLRVLWPYVLLGWLAWFGWAVWPTRFTVDTRNGSQLYRYNRFNGDVQVWDKRVGRWTLFRS